MASEHDRHLTEEEVLRYADGEIPEGRSWIAQHLLACWDCRGRLSDLEATIKAIIQFRKNEFLPAVPNPPRPWANLGDRLRSQASQARQQRFWNRILSAIHHHHGAATGAGFVVAGATFAGIWLLHPPAVSASTALAKASAAESTVNLNSLNRTVHQQFRLRKTMRHDSRETSEDPKPRSIPNSDDVEMEIRHTLHRLGADFGDPITVGRGPEGKVVVDVLGVTPQRLTQIEDLMARYPAVIVGRTGTLPSGSQLCNPCAPAGPLAVSLAPGDLDQKLRKHLGGPDEVEAFAHETLTLSDRAMSHAYALKSLASRYDETAEQALSGNSGQRLSEMTVAHAASIAETVSELEIQTRPVLRELGIGRGLLPNTPEDHSWQRGAMEVFNQVRTVDRLLKTAFTTNNSSIVPTEALQRLAVELSIENALLTRYRALVEKESSLK